MSQPIISVLMSTYNDSAYIEEAIYGVLSQSFESWELIIFDDASSDDTVSKIKKINAKDKRIILYENKLNKGLIDNLNSGIEVAKGKYIARIDGDDVWIDNDKLKKQLQVFKNNKEIVLVGSWAIRIDSDRNTIGSVKYPILDKEIRNYINIENCFINSSVIFRKQIPDVNVHYDQEFLYCEDYCLWLKMGMSHQFQNVPQMLVGYRQNPKGVSMTKYSVQLGNTIRLIRKYGKSYPNFMLGLLLWHARKHLARKFREKISKSVRKVLFFH